MIKDGPIILWSYAMPLHDTGDIVRAVGFVAIYGAYLEDRIAGLIDICNGKIELRKNIYRLSATDQTRHLLDALMREFNNVDDYSSKMQDSQQVSSVLNEVDGYLKDRHVVIHSTLISKSGGEVIMRSNRRSGIKEQVTSKEVIDLANNLFELQSQVNGLKFSLQRLIQAK